MHESDLELESTFAAEPSPRLVANRQLADIFSELEEAGVEYCVLRGIDELRSTTGWQEVDLLVAPRDRKLFAYTVCRNGFSAWPSWGHEPHEFFMAYDGRTGSWLKLDVVSELRYGKPFRCLPARLSASCFHDRQRWGPTWVIAKDDELLTTTLHCVLDKGHFRVEHRQRLTELWKQVSENVRLRVRFERKATQLIGKDGFTAVAYAVQHADWSSLVAMRSRWRGRFFRRAPMSTAWSYLRSALLRRARRMLFALRRRGTSTVLLAPDGGGKSTLAAALANDPLLRARVVYMGGNEQAGGLRLPASRWLAAQTRVPRRRRRRPWYIRIRDAMWRSLLRPFNTVNHLVEDWVRCGVGLYHKLNGRFVVYDRYFYDTYLSPRANSRRVRLRRWVLRRTAAKPDRVLLLDAPGEVLYARKQEHSPKALEAQRRILLELSQHIPNVNIVDTTQGADATLRRAVWVMWNDHATRQKQPTRKPRTHEPEALRLRELG